jgi:hypothetical protein
MYSNSPAELNQDRREESASFRLPKTGQIGDGVEY